MKIVINNNNKAEVYLLFNINGTCFILFNFVNSFSYFILHNND